VQLWRLPRQVMRTGLQSRQQRYFLRFGYHGGREGTERLEGPELGQEETMVTWERGRLRSGWGVFLLDGQYFVLYFSC
jgi:hypothetical protein